MIEIKERNVTSIAPGFGFRDSYGVPSFPYFHDLKFAFMGSLQKAHSQ